jgi:hypothetical protein
MANIGLGREWLVEEGEVCTSPLLLPKQEKVWTKYHNVPYCWLWKAIAEFYQTEELKACRRVEYFGNPPFDDYYYDRVIADCVELILLFGLSAVVGEARHFSRRAWSLSDLRHIDNADELIKAQEVARRAFSALKRLLGFGEFNSHTTRVEVYRRAIPYNYWPSVIVLCKKVYNGRWQGGGFGGKSWYKVVEALQKVMYSWALGSYKQMVIQTDQLVNLCHNHGLMLNKFNCGGYQVEKVLMAKKDGDSFYLSQVRFRGGDLCSEPGCRPDNSYYKIWTNKEVK